MPKSPSGLNRPIETGLNDIKGQEDIKTYEATSSITNEDGDVTMGEGDEAKNPHDTTKKEDDEMKEEDGRR